MNATPKKSNEAPDSDSKLDQEFVKAMLDIEKHYNDFNKHDKIRIEQWSKKLCQITQNSVWKQNRNNYALILLHYIKKGSLEEPFTKVPPEDSLPPLNKHIVKKRLGPATSKANKNKTVEPQKSSRAPTEPDSSSYYNDMYSEKKTPHKTESVNQSQDLNWSLQKRGFGTPSEGYMSDRHREEEYVNRNGNQGYNGHNNGSNNGIVENTSKEMNKLKGELELARLKLQNIESELEIRDMTISQLNKKIVTTQNMVKNLQEEKSTMGDLLNTTKTAIENESLVFTNPALATKFTKKFNQHCHEFSLDSLRLPPPRPSDYHINTSQLSIKTSPGKPDFRSNIVEKSPDMINYGANGNRNRGNLISNDFGQSKNMSFQKRGDISLDDSQDFLGKRLQSSVSSTKSVKSTNSRYDEVKSFLETNDKNTMDFLASLEKFQKDNEKLKKEAKDMLLKKS